MHIGCRLVLVLVLRWHGRFTWGGLQQHHPGSDCPSPGHLTTTITAALTANLTVAVPPTLPLTHPLQDYHPGSDQWSPLGTTGIFAWAVAIAPTKDNYWSTDHQTGSAYSDYATISEPYNRLQAAVHTTFQFFY